MGLSLRSIIYPILRVPEDSLSTRIGSTRKRDYVTRFTKSLTCLSPVPSSFISFLLAMGHQALRLEPYNPSVEDPKATHSTLCLDSLVIHTTPRENNTLSSLTKLVRPTILKVVNSPAGYSITWVTTRSIVPPHWSNLKELIL